MAWGYLSKMRQFGKGASNVDNAINQAQSKRMPAPKWTSKPTSSFAKANTFAGSGGFRSRPGRPNLATLASNRRRQLDDEDF
jgi:hypothetical protein